MSNYEVAIESAKDKYELAAKHTQFGRFEDAIKEIKDAIKLLENVLKLHSGKSSSSLIAELCNHYYTAGYIFNQSKDYHTAKLYYEKSLSLREEIYGKTSMNYCFALDALSNVCKLLGDICKSRELIEEKKLIFAYIHQ